MNAEELIHQRIIEDKYLKQCFIEKATIYALAMPRYILKDRNIEILYDDDVKESIIRINEVIESRINQFKQQINET